MSQRTAARWICGALLALVLVACSSSGTNGAPSGSSGVGGTIGTTPGGSTNSSGSGGDHSGGGAVSGGNTSGGNASSGAAGGGRSSGGNASAGAGGESGTSTNTGTSGASGASSSGGAGGAGGMGATTGTIVPLYTDPSDASWAALVTAKTAHPAVRVVGIVNPNSGPGVQVDASYTSGVTRLIAAGIVPIGYVSTAYTARGEPAVKADVDSWHAFYPNLQGIFFDEQSDKAGDDTFYRDVSAYAKGLGLSFTVGNPGTSVPTSYAGAVDVMLIYESKGLPTLSSLAGHAATRSQYGIIPYGAAFDAAFVSAAKADVAYVYATSDDLPNPWDTLTPYFGDLLAALER